ncbi:MAG: hypothetical protein BMS9Abin01_1395 [Gammaproteobacteria bacterium]|nr:MAG: hypothetical protein BMS9Abin01_1395 [Gammaproteobacteria bacterium]
MRSRTHLARITSRTIALSWLSVATLYAVEDTTRLAQASPDVEMSTISGEAANPRRHYRLRDPEPLDAERAAEIYAIAREAMRVGYPLSGLQVARGYQNWRRYNSAPYLSASHGNHYLNNYANERARAYGEFEAAGRLPVGAVIAKDSFSVTKSGGILLGPLFIMEKMPKGFNYVSGDWKYTLVRADGTLFGETNGPGATRVEYCIACHLARERYDHLYFVPKDYRR